MPESRFRVEWPDGIQEVCYSPSLVIKQYLEAGTEYSLSDFLERSRTALEEGSNRVKAKYGFPCSLALGQVDKIEAKVAHYASVPDPMVKVLAFLDG
jgi:uncharacterized repeat protein (TIGR04042 family)